MTGRLARRDDSERSESAHLVAPIMMRELELHEARAHAHGGRRVLDLRDAILLHDPLERDPFMNRLSGLRLPSDRAGFDRRLTELMALFASIARRPHVRLSPAFHSPDDLAERLVGEGFTDRGGTYAMVQATGSGLRAAVNARAGAEAGSEPPLSLPREARLERLSASSTEPGSLLRGAARVVAEAFGAAPGGEKQLAADLAHSSAPERDVCVTWLADEPVAAGRRFTAHGMTYLSSIGTRPGWWGHGFGSAVTAALAEDGRQAGGSLVHLGVEWHNDRAIAMYQRLGFHVVGDRIADLLLE